VASRISAADVSGIVWFRDKLFSFVLLSFNMHKLKARPFVVKVLILLFVFGTAASLISAISLTFPGSFLEPIWKLNPQAREGFALMGGWSIVLMSLVCVACLVAAIGLWWGSRWGYWLAVALLITNLIGDVINVVVGTERRAIIGIPIVLLLLIYLFKAKASRTV